MNRDKPMPSGYFPNTPSQWREPTIDDCTWYATELAFERASKDHITRHPVKVLRANSSDQTGGTPVELCMAEVQEMWPVKQGVAHIYGEADLIDIVTALTTDATIVIGGDYEKLPPHYRRWTNNDIFNHAMAHWDIRATSTGLKTFLYDPLGGGPERDPYLGEWIDLHDLYGPDKFVWRGNKDETYMVGIVANREVDSDVIEVNVHEDKPASRAVRISEGAKAYANPSVTSAELRSFKNKDRWHPCLGKTKTQFRLVLWDTENGWDAGYVPKADIIETKVVPAPAADAEEIERLNDIIDDLVSELTRILQEIEATSTPAE